MLRRDAILVFVMLFCIAVFSAVYYAALDLKKEKPFCIFAVCCAVFACSFFLYLAVFARSPHTVETALVPLWSYRAVMTGEGGLDVFAQIIENITIFIPIGFLMPFVFGKEKSSFLTVGLFGFALSLIAEVSQYVFSLGICETDDLINNTVGTLVGFGLWYSMTACTYEKNRTPCAYDIKEPKRFVSGLIPIFAVYEILIITGVVRGIMHII